MTAKRLSSVLLVAFLSAAGESGGREPAEAERPSIQSEAELESVIARLEDDGTRLAAIERLFDFTRGSWVYQRPGSGPVDPLAERAVAAMEPYADLATAERAMRSRSATLRVWGLSQLSNYDDSTLAAWRHLLPLVRELAGDESADVRGRAQQSLKDQRDQGRFLARCAEAETSADNIMWIVGSGPGLGDRLNPHLVRLLGHADAKARKSALLCIGSDSNRARVWQADYSDEVVDRVFALSRSPVGSDRGAAAFALDDLQRRYPERVRLRMLEMAADPSADVRWRVASALKMEKDRSEVRETLERLLRDESPDVRYFALTSLGVENHLEELRDLAGGEGDVADRARRRLENLNSLP